MNEEDGHIEAKPSRFRIGSVVWTIVWSLVIFFLLTTTGLITVIEVPFRLVFGCLIHLWNLVPSLLFQWQSLLLPLACLAISLPLAHRFIAWFAVSNGRAAWRISHSIAVIFLLFAGSAAAIAMSGITHQMAWLADAPWWNDRNRRDSTEAMMKIRNLQMVITEFHFEHGRYPESLVELADRIPNFGRGTTMPSGLAELPEPFVYLKPEADAAEDPPLPMLVSPILKFGRVAVGFTDHSTQALHVKQLESILDKEVKP
jgi:hypothetical protein